MMLDSIIVSDIHLGSPNCQSKLFLDFITKIKENIEGFQTKKLIIAGDLFDHFGARLSKVEWKILGTLRAISNDLELIWVKGNHDTYTESSSVSPLLGSEFYPVHYIFESGDKKIIITHGDMFDNFISEHPVLTMFSDWIYWCLQKVDRSYRLARFAKRSSKKYLHCSEVVETEAKDYAKKFKCDIAICGHTHMAISNENYFNSGSWAELPCSYITVNNGNLELIFLH